MAANGNSLYLHHAPSPRYRVLKLQMLTPVKGHTPRTANAVPSWNPAVLLQPNRRNTTPDSQTPTLRHFSSSQISRPHSHSNPSDPVVFQFSSPNESASAGPSSRASTPSSVHANGANGVGAWIERMNNVQHRSNVPQPKRRKTEDWELSQDGGPALVRGGSGMLGEYVQEKRREADGSTASQAMTVDLTDGIHR